MFPNFHELGMPPGPLADPIVVKGPADGSFKTHLIANCQHVWSSDPGRTTTLWDLPDAWLCSACRRKSDQLTAPAVKVRDAIVDVLGLIESVLAVDGDPTQLHRCKVETTYARLDAYAECLPDVFIEHDPDLEPWVRDRVAPAAARARDALLTHRPDLAAPDRFARAAAAATMDEDKAWHPERYPALCARSRKWSWHRDAGQDHIVSDTRTAAVDAFTRGLDRSQVHAAALTVAYAKLAQLPGPELLEQVDADAVVPAGPLGAAVDAVWRPAATRELAEITTELVDALFAELDAVLAAPVTAAVWRRSPDHDRFLWMRAPMRPYRVANWVNGGTLAFIPEPVLNWMSEGGGKGAVRPDIDFGPVQPGDTPEVFISAGMIAKATGVTRPEALELARASHEPVSA